MPGPQLTPSYRQLRKKRPIDGGAVGKWGRFVSPLGVGSGGTLMRRENAESHGQA